MIPPVVHMTFHEKARKELSKVFEISKLESLTDLFN